MHTQLDDNDKRLYNKFNILVPDRWQAEMMGECVFVCVCIPTPNLAYFKNVSYFGSYL